MLFGGNDWFAWELNEMPAFQLRFRGDNSSPDHS
jgi:hypothetical protein